MGSIPRPAWWSSPRRTGRRSSTRPSSGPAGSTGRSRSRSPTRRNERRSWPCTPGGRRGGRAGERLVLGEVSTGASNDLAGATQLAIRMVREFGMSARLGPVGFASGGPAYLGQQEIRSRDYAEATQQVIDEEVARLLGEADGRAARVLETNRGLLDRLVDLLMERETIDGAEVYELVGRPMPGEVPRIAATQGVANPFAGT